MTDRIDPITGGLAPATDATPAPSVAAADFEVALESLNQWQLAWRRFRRHPMALVGSIIFGFMILLAIVGPILWPYNPIGVRSDLPGTQGFSPMQMPPFGSDGAGRPVWVLVANGARLSMLIGISTMLISVTIGTIVGAIAGYFGGRVDGILMRLVDLFLSIPFLFVILVAARFFGGGELVPIILIFGLLFWPGLARLVRALYLSLREQDFVDAARAVGVSDFRIAFRHILPNAIGPIVVTATLLVANAIATEAFISFLNFGLKAQDISWGNALADAQTRMSVGNWWWPFFPGMAIALTVIAVNFMGDGLRDALDPRSRD
jgi:ABC-type dipeptide/oligopeptide/nickel transport system permease subunit